MRVAVSVLRDMLNLTFHQIVAQSAHIEGSVQGNFCPYQRTGIGLVLGRGPNS